jgi:hypothetical protein
MAALATSSNLGRLAGESSIYELLDLQLELNYLVKEVLDAVPELYLKPDVNPERIVGETSEDGTIESTIRKTRRSSVPTSGVLRVNQIINVILISLKANAGKHSSLIMEEVEKELAKYFRTLDLSKRDVSLNVSEIQAIEALNAPPRSPIAPPRGVQLPTVDESAVVGVRRAQLITSQLKSKYGNQAIPKEIRESIFRSEQAKIAFERANKSNNATENRTKSQHDQRTKLNKKRTQRSNKKSTHKK